MFRFVEEESQVVVVVLVEVAREGFKESDAVTKPVAKNVLRVETLLE